MVDVGVFYRYTWQGNARAMHARLVGDTVTVNEADPVTCEHTELAGVFSWDGQTLTGAGLSNARKADISALLITATQVSNV